MNNSKHRKLVNFLLKYQFLEEGSYREDIKRVVKIDDDVKVPIVIGAVTVNAAIINRFLYLVVIISFLFHLLVNNSMRIKLKPAKTCEVPQRAKEMLLKVIIHELLLGCL
jgi:hypothetical protein